MKKVLLIICMCIMTLTVQNVKASDNIVWLEGYEFVEFDNSKEYFIGDNSDVIDYKGNLVVSLKNLPYTIQEIDLKFEDIPVYEVLKEKELILTGISSPGNSIGFGLYDFKRNQIIEPKYQSADIVNDELFLGRYYITNENSFKPAVDIFTLDGIKITFKEEIYDYNILDNEHINIVTMSEKSIIINSKGDVIENYVSQDNDKQPEKNHVQIIPFISDNLDENVDAEIYWDNDEQLEKEVLVDKNGKVFNLDFDVIESERVYYENGQGYERRFNNGLTIVTRDGQFGILTNPLVYNTNALYNKATVLVDGKKVNFESYTIFDNNYFKLRDIAQVLNGTECQFNIEWIEQENMISIEKNTNYKTGNGSILEGDYKNKNAVMTNSTIKIDDKISDIKSYNINGNNYFKLRDLSEVFGFSVEWNGETKTIVVNT